MIKKNKRKIYSAFVFLMVIISLFTMTYVSASAIGIWGSGTGQTGGGSIGGTGGTYFGMDEKYSIAGFRFTLTNSDGTASLDDKNYKRIDIIRSDKWSEYNSDTRYTTSSSYHKKELIDKYKKNTTFDLGDMKVTEYVNAGYAKKDDGYGLSYTVATLSSDMTTWKDGANNVNKILEAMGYTQTINYVMSGTDKLLIEPIVMFRYKTTLYAMTLTEIWTLAGSEFGYGTKATYGDATKNTYNYMAYRLNGTFPNNFYVGADKQVCDKASVITIPSDADGTSKSPTFANLIEKGYGLHIIYKDETKLPILRIYTQENGAPWSTSGLKIKLVHTDGTEYILDDNARNKDEHYFYKNKAKIGTYKIYASKSTLDYDNFVDTGETINVKADCGIKTINYYSLALETDGNIKLSTLSGAGTYLKGQYATVHADPKDGYTFTKWENKKTGKKVSENQTYSGCCLSGPGDNAYNNGSKVLKAYATANTYKATFNPNNGKFSDNATSNKTKDYTITDTLTGFSISRTGYSFAGWKVTYTEGNWVKDTIYSSQTVLANKTGMYGKVTFTAQWNPYELTVNYYSNYADYAKGTGLLSGIVAGKQTPGQTKISTSVYTYDVAASSGLADYTNSNSTYLYLSRTGYSGTGYWSKNANGSENDVLQTDSFATGQALATKLGVDISNGNKTVNVYAQWNPYKLTVNYYSNYATAASGSGVLSGFAANTQVKVATSTYVYDDACSNGLADYTNSASTWLYLTRTGYSGSGYWHTNANGSGNYAVHQNTSYATSQLLATALGKNISDGNQTVDVYAQWTAIPKTYYKLSLDGILDGEGRGTLDGFATIKLKVNGNEVLSGTDINQYSIEEGSTYEISVSTNKGFEYLGIASGYASLSGKMNSDKNVLLNFRSLYDFDINGMLDNTFKSNVTGFGSFKLWLKRPGESETLVKVNNNETISDYSSYIRLYPDRKQGLPKGTTYKIEIIDVTHYNYINCNNGNFTNSIGTQKTTSKIITGTIDDNTELILKYETSKYMLDVNGYLDEVNEGDLIKDSVQFGKVYVYINDTLTKYNDAYSDFYVACKYGSTYRIEYEAIGDHKYMGVNSGSLEGTITGNTNVRLDFRTLYNFDIDAILDGVYEQSPKFPSYNLYITEPGSSKKHIKSTTISDFANYVPSKNREGETGFPYGTKYEITSIGSNNNSAHIGTYKGNFTNTNTNPTETIETTAYIYNHTNIILKYISESKWVDILYLRGKNLDGNHNYVLGNTSKYDFSNTYYIIDKTNNSDFTVSDNNTKGNEWAINQYKISNATLKNYNVLSNTDFGLSINNTVHNINDHVFKGWQVTIEAYNGTSCIASTTVYTDKEPFNPNNNLNIINYINSLNTANKTFNHYKVKFTAVWDAPTYEIDVNYTLNGGEIISVGDPTLFSFTTNIGQNIPQNVGNISDLSVNGQPHNFPYEINNIQVKDDQKNDYMYMGYTVYELNNRNNKLAEGTETFIHRKFTCNVEVVLKFRQVFNFDINALVNGEELGNTEGYGTFNITLTYPDNFKGGSETYTNQTDFWRSPTSVGRIPYGTLFDLSVHTTNSSYSFNGYCNNNSPYDYFSQGSTFSGEVKGPSAIRLKYTSKITIAYDCYNSNVSVQSGSNYYLGDYNRICTTNRQNQTILGTDHVYYDCVDYNAEIGLYGFHAFNIDPPSGYEFSHWKNNGGKTFYVETKYTASDFLENASTGTLSDGSTYVWFTAVFRPKTYTATFEPNSGTFSDNSTSTKSIQYQTGNSITPVPTVSRSYHTFLGWKITSANGNWTIDNKLYTNSEISSITNKFGNVTFTAIWRVNKLTIAYDCYGSNVFVQSDSNFSLGNYNRICTTVEANKTIAGTNNVYYDSLDYNKQLGENGLHDFHTFKLNAPFGYKFSHWKNVGGKTFDTTTRYYASQLIDNANSGLNDSDAYIWLTAVFVPEDYSIDYSLNGGSVSSLNPTGYTINTNNFTLNNPTKNDYVFNGWTERITPKKWYKGYVHYETGAIEEGNKNGWPNSRISEKIRLEAGITYKINIPSELIGKFRLRIFDINGNYLKNESDTNYISTSYTPNSARYVIIMYHEGSNATQESATYFEASVGTNKTIYKGSTGDRYYTAVFKKVYVTYDSIFSFEKWNDNGISVGQDRSGSVDLVYKNNVPIGLTLTSADTTSGWGDAYTNLSHAIPIVDNKINYKFDCDITINSTSASSNVCQLWVWYFDNNNKEIGSNSVKIDKFSGTQTQTLNIEPLDNCSYIKIRVDANHNGNKVTFSNFRIYPVGCWWMSNSVNAEDRTDISAWSNPMPIPKAEGYRFVAWSPYYTSATDPYSDNFGKPIKSFPTEDKVIYSNWDKGSYNIEYYLNGTKQTTKSYEFGIKYNYEQLPTVANSVEVSGWYDNSNCVGSPTNGEQEFMRSAGEKNETIKMYAYSTHSINYYLDGQEKKGLKQTYKYGQTCNTPTVPTKNNAAGVSGWYPGNTYADKGEQKSNRFTVRRNLNLYAFSYIDFVFSKNGGTVGTNTNNIKDSDGKYIIYNDNTTVRQHLYYNDSLDENGLWDASSFGLYKDGYKIKKNFNWNTSSDGKGTDFDKDNVYSYNEVINQANDEGLIVLYANWIPIEYTIVFNGNGATSGSMKPMQMTYDEEKNLTENGFEKTGYHFTKWKDKDGNYYTDKQPVENLTTIDGATITLYAQWTSNSVKIKVKKDDVTWNDANRNIQLWQNKKKISDLTYKDDSYYVKGISNGTYNVYSKDSNNQVSDTGIEIVVENNMVTETLYYYTLTVKPGTGIDSVFIINNEEHKSTSSLSYVCRKGEEVYINADVSRGYKWLRWKDGINDNNINVKRRNIIIDSKKEYTAMANLIKYTITYKWQDGTVIEGLEPTYYTVEDEVKLPTLPSEDGYNITYWYKNEECNGETTNIIEKNSIGDRNFYAKKVYNKIIKYMVRHWLWDPAVNDYVEKADDRIGPSETNDMVLVKVNEYPQYECERTHYAEYDKYNEEDGFSELNNEGPMGESFYVSKNKNSITDFYYRPKTVSLQYKLNGGLYEGIAGEINRYVICYSNQTLLEDPVKNDSSFTGWYKEIDANGNAGYMGFNPASFIITKDTVLEATWGPVSAKEIDIVANQIHGDVVAGSQITVSATAINRTEDDLTNENPAKVTLKIVDKNNNIIIRNTAENKDVFETTVVIPKYNKNLVYFNVDIPEDLTANENLEFIWEISKE